MKKNIVDVNDPSTYAICKICNKKLSRVDGNHIATHGLNTVEYDKQFNTCKFDRIAKNLFKWLKFTRETAIEKYGLTEGIERWNQYRQKQSTKNTFEYKRDKYGWSKEEFDTYNKKRACTRENFIIRHGQIAGTARWEQYVEAQRFVGSCEQYFIDKYGVEAGSKKWRDICILKKHNLQNYIHKHGEDEGRIKYRNYLTKLCQRAFVSKISQDLFKLVENSNHDQYYADKNKEFCIYDQVKKRPFLYDFVDITTKKCIEFNGDCFHANPNIYKSNDIPNPFNKSLTAKDIWDFDEYKNNLLRKNGYELMIVWESDFKKSPDEHVLLIKKFLYGI